MAIKLRINIQRLNAFFGNALIINSVWVHGRHVSVEQNPYNPLDVKIDFNRLDHQRALFKKRGLNKAVSMNMRREVVFVFMEAAENAYKWAI